MSAEFIPMMTNDGGMYQIFEFDVTRHVVGDAETVRAGLTDALEQLGYRVLNDNPIQARRITRGGAGCEFSSDVLDYQTTLNIGLKSVGSNSTRVVFDYKVKGTAGGWLSKGDRKTLTREAEAIIATAMTRATGTHCSACGNDTAGSSRFCRKCGSPLTAAAAPAEKEVLRLTARTNAAQKNLGFGLLFLLIGAALLLILPFGSADPIKFVKLVKIIGFLSSAFGGIGLWMIFYSWFKLRQVVSQPIEQDSLPAPRRNVIESLPVPTTNELTPVSIQHPITEGTTDLLPHEIKRAS